ncbi:Elf4 domain-containing protein [Clostridium bowmanii]|uniref:Elf4 domain-containing protein n=1 Tax=Clostridium bowmanii TaxID=132925 RepID=UPI001C0E67C0|nr:Elf4 domain-containing protein [Clostridium bowmanii]MBU3188974.1 Elf4 domain-containing protein [Clostridium bowmanii]MCA1073615.1 Elf4 domain-containing protein [Clostridium bowmanii]
MNSEFNYIDEIMSEHNERMQNLKKYYPFFKIRDVSLDSFKDGIYNYIDMGYIVIATLRLFIEENNFNDIGVSFEQYSQFTTEILKRDYNLYLDEKENMQLVNYIFDKIINDGKPFSYNYFDPVEKQRMSSRIKLIESKIEDNTISYYITSQAIEFYLDTKEIKDESKISIQQILLSKMIESKNFKGGIEVVKRINNEVSKLIKRKNEILNILSYNVFEGIKASDELFRNNMKWFDEEQSLFDKNKRLIELALERIEENASSSTEEDFLKNREYIYNLETEIKRAISKHSELLNSSTDLKIKSDEIIKKVTLNKLRMSFDFKAIYDKTLLLDNVELLAYLMNPLLKIKFNKTFNLKNTDELLTYRPNNEEDIEEVTVSEEIEYTSLDDVEDERIAQNFIILMKLLMKCLLEKGEFSLREFNEYLVDVFKGDILKNGDYYSFILHIAQKNYYDMAKLIEDEKTIFDKIIIDILTPENRNEFKGLKFKVIPIPEDVIEISSLFKITNIKFERVE